MGCSCGKRDSVSEKTEEFGERSELAACNEAQSSGGGGARRRSVRIASKDEIVEDEREGADCEKMLRQFTRRSLSNEEGFNEKKASSSTLGRSLTSGGRRNSNRRDSRIDDKDVLKLLASRSKNPKDFDEIKRLQELEQVDIDQIDLKEVKEVAPELAKRVEKRRKTMEKLDVFSPDIAADRLEELYDATEKLLD